MTIEEYLDEEMRKGNFIAGGGYVIVMRPLGCPLIE